MSAKTQDLCHQDWIILKNSTIDLIDESIPKSQLHFDT